MDFDFKNSYKNYTDLELLKITLYRSQYHPEAAAAAQALLNERGVTDSDRAAGWAQIKQQAEQEEEQKTSNIIFKKTKLIQATAYVHPAMEPHQLADARKWFNILCTAQILGIIWELVQNNFFMSLFYRSDISLAELYLVAFYRLRLAVLMGLLLYLFYRKRKWGWILLLASHLVSFISFVLLKCIMFEDLGPFATFSTTFITAVHAAYIIALLRDNMVNYFSISDDVKKKTVQVAALLAIAVVVVQRYYMFHIIPWG